jgi:hypothetical protein
MQELGVKRKIVTVFCGNRDAGHVHTYMHACIHTHKHHGVSVAHARTFMCIILRGTHAHAHIHTHTHRQTQYIKYPDFCVFDTRDRLVSSATLFSD